MFLGFPGGSAGKESACNAGDLGSIPGLGRFPGEGKGYPLQYSDPENSMGCIVHGVAKGQTPLSHFHFHFQGFPGGLDGRSRICLQCKRCKFKPWVRKVLWRREWQRTLVLLLGESHGQRSLEGYSSWGCKESDTTEQLTHNMEQGIVCSS